MAYGNYLYDALYPLRYLDISDFEPSGEQVREYARLGIRVIDNLNSL